MGRPRVLLAADAGEGCLAAVRGLAAGGYEPWVAVSRRHAYAARSRAAAGVLAVSDADADPAGHADALARAARRLGAAAVLPGSDASLAALSGREAAFHPAAVGAGTPEALHRATAGLGALAARHRLPPAPAGLAERRLAVAGRPAPAEPAELAAVSGLVRDGRMLSALHQRSPRIWPSETGRSAYAVTVAPDPGLEAAVAALLAEVGWTGLYHVPLLVAADGAWLLDLVLTPGTYGSLALAVAAGHNLAAGWADLVCGRPVDLGPYRVGAGLRCEERDAPALAATVLAGRPRAALRALRPGRDRRLSVLSPRDPAPALTLGRRLGEKAGRRARRLARR